MAYNIPTIFVALAIGYTFLAAVHRITQDTKEPPSIHDGVPFISPLLAMFSKGGKFYRRLRDKYNLPIYTLRLPGTRFYIINSAPLITAVQSQFKVLSFTAIEAALATKVFGVSKATSDILEHNVAADEGYLMMYPKYIHAALAAGPELDAMNRTAIRVIADSIEERWKQGTSTVNMYRWIRREMLIASTDSVYGPKNPYRDPQMQEAWDVYERGMMKFVIGLYARLFARDSYKAREYMVTVWEKYFQNKWHEQGSAYVKARVKINADFEIPQDEAARMEIGGAQAVITNTLPGTFWVVYHIFSNPVIVEDIRTELYKGVRRDGDGTHVIDWNFVKTSCPILLSTFKETMRFHSSATATRFTLEDHVLENKYLLKKGSTIMMPAAVQHTDQSVWGNTVDEFLHRRFLREPGTKRINPIAFRGFGGGTTLCPGRHFASAEILMFAALLVLRFDLHPVAGKWTTPTWANASVIQALPEPDWDVEAELRPREDGAKWKVTFSADNVAVDLAAEDIEGATPDLGN